MWGHHTPFLYSYDRIPYCAPRVKRLPDTPPLLSAETTRRAPHRAGSGVCRYLRDRAERARCEHIRAVTHHVELNASAEFMEQYIMNMNFNVL